jgi:signal transduction histidine kinase
MQENRGPVDPETRVERYALDSNLTWVTAALLTRREEILRRWLDAATSQPSHVGRRDRAVADDIPRLLDALIAYLDRARMEPVDADAPLKDEAIIDAAQAHAVARVSQGLQPAAVLAEFRILRQEIWRALRLGVPDGAPTSDVIGAELLLNDALDGAMALALSALTERIEQQREEFLATLVHEVRNPVTRVLGFTQLAQRTLDREPPDLGRIRTSLAAVRRAIDEMDVLLGSLAEASRLELGGLHLHRAPTDLVDLVTDVVDRLPPDTRERIELTGRPLDPAVGPWDASRLRQVLMNLLSNAAKYSDPGSPITLAVRREMDDAIVNVTDRGIGIPPQDLPRLFGRYVRASNALDSEVQGVGLGLYVSHGIVAAHGGTLTVESVLHEGSTFTIRLPLHQGPETEMERAGV